MRVAGLTGGIGSGKSTVARLLADRGAVVIDADQLARAAVAPGTPGLAAIVERFGDEYLNADGQLDRRRLGRHVFGDPKALADLNGIVHPEVAKLVAAERAAAEAAGAALLVYDVPLLFENRLDAMYRPVIVVSVDASTQRERVRSRDDLSDQEIEDRIRAQMPLTEKVARADYVIDNNGDVESTARQVDEIYAALTEEDPS